MTFVSADNEPVTRTGGPGADRGPWCQSALSSVALLRTAVFFFFFQCGGAVGGEREKEGGEEDLFKATHFLYLSSGERRDG